MSQRRLPVKQLVILSICRFAEPIALTSVFPYLPEMIESFGVPQNDIARWAGLTSAVFSFAQCLTGIPWGAASDRFGRKPIIMLGLFNTMLTMLIFGFSTSLPMAITARALQGLSNGNVGILRTMVAELCPWKELQPRAFSVMPLVYTIGSIIGPTLGGALANPLRTDPSEPRGSRFFERYPYSLPNIVAAVLFTMGILTGILFLKETLETKRNAPDYGVIVGNRLTAFVRKTLNLSRPQEKLHNEREPLLGHRRRNSRDEESAPKANGESKVPEGKPTFKEILTKQTCLNLLVYTFLAFYSLAFDQVMPVYMHHPPMSDEERRNASLLKFSGGFGIDSRRIGLIFTAFSVFTTISQFVLFPPLARKFGVLRCLRTAFLIFPFVFLITPFTALLPTTGAQELAVLIIMIFRGLAGTFAFPTSTILITNSATSLRTLGTLNGIATSVSAIGRGLGPAVAGAIFTMGVKHGYIIAPFWLLALIAVIASIPTWFLVEGKGFGDDPDSDTDSAHSGELSSGEEQEVGIPKISDVDEAAISESEYGEPGQLLSHTPTRSSLAMESEDDMLSDEDAPARQSRRATSSSEGEGGSFAPVRSHSNGHRRVRRRSSVPVGMGIGFRRLSSNLGSTGLGGASWGGSAQS